jgi:hypothetical protein
MKGVCAEGVKTDRISFYFVLKSTDSPLWKRIMRVKYDFFSLDYFKIGNGQNT